MMKRILAIGFILFSMAACKKSDDPGLAFKDLEVMNTVNSGEFAWIQKGDWNFSLDTSFCAKNCIIPTNPGPCQGSGVNIPAYWHFGYSMTQDTVICWDFNAYTLPADPYCHVVDLSQAPDLHYLGKFRPLDTYLAFAGMKGGLLFALRDVSVLAIYDIRNLDPLNPDRPLSDYEIGHFQLEEITYTAYVHFKENYAYVGGNGSHIYILDISDPANPVLKGDVIVQLSKGFMEHDGFLYNRGNGNIDILDIHDPLKPKQVSRMQIANNDIDFKDGYLFVANTDGLHIYDISHPSDPKLVRILHTGSNELMKIYFFGNYIVCHSVDRSYFTPTHNRLFLYPATP